MTEVWKPVVSHPSHYEVSSLGRVRRIKPGRGATAGRILAPCPQNGYVAVTLYENDRRIKKGIHILVAEAFHGRRPAGKIVNHQDGNKANNRQDNLEWTTQGENAAHAVATGLSYSPGLPGEANGRARLTIEQVIEIRSLKGKASQRQLAREFDVARTTIQLIHQGKNWRSDRALQVRQMPAAPK